ncbi:MAG: GvpL/GvpF family gas vesicle protein [Actinobacteria bacterium]|nr:GvpL/GvpF family gas vesicle protein [Actinomycetota bacterium]
MPADLGLGLEGAPLRAIEADPLAAVFSAHETAPGADEDKLWQHEAVVERLMEEVAVLPFRFGTTVADQGELETLLRGREEQLGKLLDEVRGAVELSVRGELPVPESRPVGNGTEYMRERGRSLRSQELIREQLHRPLDDLSRRSVLAGPGAGFKGAYLVDGDRVDAFAERVRVLSRDLDLVVSCTGPWPPYNFVSGSEG